MQVASSVFRQIPRSKGFVLSAIVMLLAIVCLFNPFAFIAGKTAEFASPTEEITRTLPTTTNTAWCLAGEFQGWNSESHPMNDEGQGGDETADDGIFSLNLTFPEAGRYEWLTVECGNWEVFFPVENAWVYAREAGQTVTFTFDTNVYEDSFWPKQFIVNAKDSLLGVTAVGDFQGWNSSDPRTAMKPIGEDWYQVIYPINEPGVYQGAVMVTGTKDGYQTIGRSVRKINWEIPVEGMNEAVIFTFQATSGRVGIQYGIPFVLAWLAYQGGAQIVGGVGFLVSSFSALWLWRSNYMYDRTRWRTKGCPNCHEQTLRRTKIKTAEILLRLLFIPVGRYVCSNCGWKGRRVQDDMYL